jgi:GNAT superfamily N-acetyltransferase
MRQGAGLGTCLLLHALTEIARASRSVGFEVVVVHAIDRDAVTFYAKAGFTPFVDHPLHLFIPVKNLLATVDSLTLNCAYVVCTLRVIGRLLNV